MTTYFTELSTPVGPLVLAKSSAGLERVLFADRDAVRDPGWRRDPGALRDERRQLSEWLAGERDRFDLTLAPRGTPFQLRVWRALEAIPFGRTTTYGALARAIGAGASASRAVGAANANNPLPIVVPCHRVIGARGALVGYAGGLPRKRWLLEHEARVAARAAALSRRRTPPTAPPQDPIDSGGSRLSGGTR
jgi:methylated-DNA-[protein]-cysteine S-methyltransferase